MNEPFKFERIPNWNFSKLDSQYGIPGIYMLIFPDGKRYLGKSKDISRRIRQHFKAFSFYSDWHSIARPTFTNFELFKPKPALSDPTCGKYCDQLIYSYKELHYPEWKRLTKKRRDTIYKEYIVPLYKEYLASVETHEREEQRYRDVYYNMCCDFFHNVKLYVWKVPKEDITEAEDLCLNQIAIEGKKFRYYNTVYPKNKGGDR